MLFLKFSVQLYFLVDKDSESLEDDTYNDDANIERFNIFDVFEFSALVIDSFILKEINM